MKNKTLRTFVIDGKEMQFNLTFFNNIFKTKAKQEKKGIGELEEELAEAIFVEKATVHAWRNRVNGPSDLEKVQLIAKYFEIEVGNLLIEVEDRMNNSIENEVKDKPVIPFGEREKDAFKRVYKQLLHFMRQRIKYDKEMLEASNGYYQDLLNAEISFENEGLTDEYMEMKDARLDWYLEEVIEKWKTVDFADELEKVNEVLEEEIVDLPKELEVYFRIFIDTLEETNSNNVEVEGTYACEDDYESDRIELRYYRDEKIVSSIHDAVRYVLDQLN